MTATHTDEPIGDDLATSATLRRPRSGLAARRRHEARRIARLRRQATTTATGAGIVDEAWTAIADGRWRDGLRLATALERIDGEQEQVDAIRAICSAEAGRRLEPIRAVARLREHRPSPVVQHALARVALTRQQYLAADAVARTSIDLDADDARPWTDLAASYAGLGWFDDARSCLDRADALTDEPDTLHVGRALNRWAMSRTFAPLITVVLFLFLGLLALAVGLTIPFVAREIRVRRLDDRLRELAEAAWLRETKLRTTHAATVFAVVVMWAALVQLV